jgi:non-specific serine/threonine protein kinase
VLLSLTRARNRLPQTEYQAARTAGRRLDRRQALALADTLLNRTSTDAPSMFERLTAREREVADLIAKGLSNGQIANGLAVTVGTARTHVDHILAKLGMHSRAQVAVWAVASGGAHTQVHPRDG